MKKGKKQEVYKKKKEKRKKKKKQRRKKERNKRCINEHEEDRSHFWKRNARNSNLFRNENRPLSFFFFFSLSLSLSNESRVNSSTTLVSPLSSRPSLATRHSPPLVIHPSFSVVSPTPHRTRFFSYSSAFPLSFPPAWSLQFSSPSPLPSTRNTTLLPPRSLATLLSPSPSMLVYNFHGEKVQTR